MVTAAGADAGLLAALAVQQARHADLTGRLADVAAAIGRLSDLDPALAARVTDRLEGAWRACQDDLDRASAAPEDEVWALLGTAQRSVQRLGRETLAWTEGALIRQSGVDAGHCRRADRLLDHLAAREKKLNWRGFTILAESALLDDLAEVVRLPYPGASFWHLPVAVHEFGHFAAPGIRVEVRDGSFRDTTQPVADFLRERWDEHDQKKWFHAHEHIADIFATFALGAAYPYCLLFHEVSPRTLRSPSPTHPSWNDRMWVVLDVLERLVPLGGVCLPVVADLRRCWQALLSASPGFREPDDVALSSIVTFLLPLLEQHLHGLRYDSFNRAQQLAVALRRDQAPTAGATAPDVLNAAWLARMHDVDDGEAAAAIAARASNLLDGL